MSTIFIGDIHGCALEFRSLLRAVGFRKSSDTLYLTGDAFTKGPDPLAVWQVIGENDARMVMGNHDARLLELFQARERGESEDHLHPDQVQTLNALAPVAEEIALWLEFLPLHIRESPFCLVHAGINPEKGFDRTSRDEFLAIRTWPPNDTLDGPRWHDHLAPTGDIIVFGHDAPGGLVIKRTEDSALPYAVGLDTGCVYGGKLSAYILEEDRVVQVDSHQPSSF